MPDTPVSRFLLPPPARPSSLSGRTKQHLKSSQILDPMNTYLLKPGKSHTNMIKAIIVLRQLSKDVCHMCSFKGFSHCAGLAFV